MGSVLGLLFFSPLYHHNFTYPLCSWLSDFSLLSFDIIAGMPDVSFTYSMFKTLLPLNAIATFILTFFFFNLS